MTKLDMADELYICIHTLRVFDSISTRSVDSKIVQSINALVIERLEAIEKALTTKPK